ncbi:MAG TPA: hypothetical protein VM840_13605 [Actinomycetota bacterium]|nr:hypothetical protein [Actinomycetota bacterium]
MPENEGQEPQNQPDGGQAGQDAGRTGTDGTPWDPDRARALIEKLRPFEKKATELERRNAELEAKLAEHENARLSDQERMSKRLKELETERETWERERREIRVAQALTSAAAAAGALYPEDVARLADPSTLEFSDDGRPSNAEAVVEKFRERRPELFRPRGPGSADGGPRGTPAPASDMNALIRRAAGRS